MEDINGPNNFIKDLGDEEQRNLEQFAVDVLAILKRLNDQGILPATS